MSKCGRARIANLSQLSIIEPERRDASYMGVTNVVEVNYHQPLDPGPRVWQLKCKCNLICEDI